MLGSILREPPLIMAEARKIGWTPDFVSSSASHTVILPKLGGKDVEGFYATALVTTPYGDGDDPRLRDWFKKFSGRFGYDPDVFAAYGWEIADLFIKTVNTAGRDLTTQSYVKAMETMHGDPDMFGAYYAFAPQDHQAGRAATSPGSRTAAGWASPSRSPASDGNETAAAVFRKTGGPAGGDPEGRPQAPCRDKSAANRGDRDG